MSKFKRRKSRSKKQNLKRGTLLMTLAAVMGLLACLDYFHLFSTPLVRNASEVELLLRTKILAGLSAGSIFLALTAYFVPIFLKDIDSPRYHSEIINGLTSSAVFFVFLEVLDVIDQKYYLKFALATIFLAILFLVCLNWALSHIKSQKKQRDIRTALVGSIVAGILFSVFIHFFTVGINYSFDKAKDMQRLLPNQKNTESQFRRLIERVEKSFQK